MKVRANIAPGVCNFDAVVTACTEDGQHVVFEFVSECDTIKAIAKQIDEISPIDAIETLGPDESPILSRARKLLQEKGCCDSCIVPAGAVKAMQVAASLALPKDVSIVITRE